MNAPPAIKWLTVGPEAAALLAQLHKKVFSDSLHDSWSEKDFSQILALPTTKAMIALHPNDTDNDGDTSGQPVGFVIFSRVLDEGEILTLGITPDQRRRGFGHDLLRAAIDHMQQNAITNIFLEVREDNEAALNLYLRHGFTLTGRRSSYYRLNNGRRLDAILMHKTIA